MGHSGLEVLRPIANHQVSNTVFARTPLHAAAAQMADDIPKLLLVRADHASVDPELGWHVSEPGLDVAQPSTFAGLRGVGPLERRGGCRWFVLIVGGVVAQVEAARALSILGMAPLVANYFDFKGIHSLLVVVVECHGGGVGTAVLLVSGGAWFAGGAENVSGGIRFEVC